MVWQLLSVRQAPGVVPPQIWFSRPKSTSRRTWGALNLSGMNIVPSWRTLHSFPFLYDLSTSHESCAALSDKNLRHSYQTSWTTHVQNYKRKLRARGFSAAVRACPQGFSTTNWSNAEVMRNWSLTIDSIVLIWARKSEMLFVYLLRWATRYVYGDEEVCGWSTHGGAIS